MQVSSKGRYGLRVMIELASQFGNGPVLVDEIAKKQEISGKYIHVIVSGLKSAGLVRSVRGPNGGYELTRAPSRITALDVISALEGKSAPAKCVLDSSSCSRSGNCASRDVWCQIASLVDVALSALSLEQIVIRQWDKDENPISYQI